MPGFGNYESAAIGPLADVFAASNADKVPSELVMRCVMDDWQPARYIANTSLEISMSEGIDWDFIDSMPNETCPAPTDTPVTPAYTEALKKVEEKFVEWRQETAETPLDAMYLIPTEELVPSSDGVAEAGMYAHFNPTINSTTNKGANQTLSSRSLGPILNSTVTSVVDPANNTTFSSKQATKGTFNMVPESTSQRSALAKTIALEKSLNTSIDSLMDEKNPDHLKALSQTTSIDVSMGDMEIMEAIKKAHESIRAQAAANPKIKAQIAEIAKTMDCMNESFTDDLQPAVLHKLMGYRASLYQGYNDEFSPEAFHRFILENPNQGVREAILAPDANCSFDPAKWHREARALKIKENASFDPAAWHKAARTKIVDALNESIAAPKAQLNQSLISNKSVLDDTFNCSQSLDDSYPDLLPLDDTFEKRADMIRMTHAKTSFQIPGKDLQLLGNALVPKSITPKSKVRNLRVALEDSFSTSFATFMDDVAQPLLDNSVLIMAQSGK